MANPKVTTKFSKVSINVSVLRDKAKRSPEVVARMEANYNRKIAPVVQGLAGRHYENLTDNFREIFWKGIPGGATPGATVRYSTLSHSNMHMTQTQSMVTGWKELSPVTQEIKGHDNFWKHTGALYGQVQGVPDVTVKMEASGVDKRRSRVTKKTGKAPLVMHTRISFSKMPKIMDELMREPFLGGYAMGSSGMFDMSVQYNILDEQGRYKSPNRAFAHMVLAETDRPFVQRLSQELGQSLRTHLEARKLW